MDSEVQVSKILTQWEGYWNNKHPKKPLIYEGRGMRNVKHRVPIDVRKMVWDDDYICKKIIRDNNLDNKAIDNIAQSCQQWICDNITYVGDQKATGLDECWQFPNETIFVRTGDCIAEYEEIYTEEGVKKVGDLVIGDKVLSYDFGNKCYCYKPIVEIWEKGELPIARTHLRNGQHVDITNDHPLWARTNQTGDSIYEKRYLSDIDLTRWWKRKLPMVKQMPYKVNDISWLTADHCKIIGHFLAEGHVEKYKVSSSGYDLIEEIIPLLDKHDIPFSESINNSGVPVINFLKSDFKEYLKKFKTNSFNIHIPEEIFHLPDYKLWELLAGFWIGDGHDGNYPDKRGFSSNKGKCYSTSSQQLAGDIQRIGLQLGTPFHVWKQENHQGVGNKPIWRITYNSNSHFLKHYGYSGLSEASISFIEDKGVAKFRDFTVKDTHTFVFKNGLVSHQCEDGAILMASLMLNAGIPAWRVRVNAGFVKPSPTAEGGGHAYVTYCRTTDNNWVILDWCYFADPYINVRDKTWAKDVQTYKEIWFSFNHLYSWSHKEYPVIKDIKKEPK